MYNFAFIRLSVLSASLVLLPIAGCRSDSDRSSLDRIQRYNSAAGAVMEPARQDSILASERTLPTAVRIGRWARRFLESDGVEYRFGPADGGYVAEGRIIHDRSHDCVSLMYRCTELAQATDHLDAVLVALRTRFFGADPDSIADSEGKVDYDRPEHLDYSLDMIRSGHWGLDVTAELSGAKPDSVGTSRYPAGSYFYVPRPGLVAGELREGDIVWLVLDPGHPAAGELRRKYGLVIGHIGIVIVHEAKPWLVHAARSDLVGWYDGGTVVRVPLTIYLDRVERFAGIVVTRFTKN